MPFVREGLSHPEISKWDNNVNGSRLRCTHNSALKAFSTKLAGEVLQAQKRTQEHVSGRLDGILDPELACKNV